MMTHAARAKNAEFDRAKSTGRSKKSEASPLPAAAPLFGAPIQRKAACACGGGCPACEAKQTDLSISQPHDAAEIEADRMADRVMQQPARASVKANDLHPNGAANPHSERVEGVNSGQVNDAGRIQRLPERSNDRPKGVPSSVNQTLAGSGAPLNASLRHDMEQRFGHDFSGVRVHTGAQAEKSARELNAHAYTLGRDIVFGRGRFEPQSETGMKLLAHELAHVVQQETLNEKVMQRWAACAEANLSGDDCPPRGQKDAQRARAGILFLDLNDLESDSKGKLLANFDIDRSNVNSLKSSLIWQQFLESMSQERSRWRLLGFADCHERKGRNKSLGKDRAAAVLRALPKPLRARIDSYDEAPAGACIRGNVNSEDRALNRSVALIKVSTEIDFSEDERDVIEAKTPQRRLQECQTGARVRTFPFRTTRFGGAPITAHRDGDEIVVKLPMHVYSNDDFRREVKTLESDAFLSAGLRLHKNEIVRVRRYELPHWYSPNLTGDASNDTKTDYCGSAELLLKFSEESERAVVINIAATTIDALTMGSPVGKWIGSGVSKITAPAVKAAQKLARNVTIGAMLGMREIAPTALAGIASRTGYTLVENRLGQQAAAQTIRTTATSSAATAAADLTASQIAPAASQTITRLSSDLVETIAGTAIMETSALGTQNLVSSVNNTASSPTIDPAPIAPAIASATTVQAARHYVTAATRAGFMRAAKRLILSRIKSGQGHLLHFLLEGSDWRKTIRVTKEGKIQKGRYEGNEHGVTVQAGHQGARASGVPEQFMLEDAGTNQVGGQTIESKGAFSFKTAVVIDDIPVDFGDALQWERLGLLPKGTVDGAQKIFPPLPFTLP